MLIDKYKYYSSKGSVVFVTVTDTIITAWSEEYIKSKDKAFIKYLEEKRGKNEQM